MHELALPIRSSPELALARGLSSDERLARLASKGSVRAFAVLYQRHHQALYRYCRSIVRDEDDAQDALQSTMTRALVALRAKERDLAVRPWLFRIAHNEAVSILRRRQPTVVLTDELEPAGPPAADILEGRDRLATLVADLQALPERQRGALLMRELSDLSIEEIAAVLSTSPGATKQILFEARRALHDFADGRAMDCEQIRRAISDGDRRVLRGRKLRGHLRECRGCSDFQEAIAVRRADLRALVPPLPGAAAALVGRLLSQGAGAGHASGLAMGSGAVAGNSATASLAVKALAGVVSVTVAAAVAGGTHFALVQGRHGHSHPASGRRAPLASPPLVSESTRTAAQQRAPSTSPAPAGKGNQVSAASAVDAGPAHPKESLTARARSASPGISSDRPATGYGVSQTRRGHGHSTLAGNRAPVARPGAARHSHSSQSGAHRLRSSRSTRGRGSHHGRAPAQHAKLQSRHGQAPAEARRSLRPAGRPSARPEEVGSAAGASGGRAASSQAGSRAEGQAPSPAASGHTRPS
jgi:RNA polymerase sigma factor (sigma-70 family)